MVSRFIPNGTLTKIILPYTRLTKNNLENNNSNIKLYVYNKFYNNKNIYTILELLDTPSNLNAFYIKTSVFIDINLKKNNLEEQISFMNNHLLYELKVNSDINSRFYYHSNDIKNIQTLDIKDRISIPTNNLLKTISNEMVKSCVDIHI